MNLCGRQSIITSVWLVYRLLTICSRALRKGALRTRSVMTVDSNTVDRITDRITIGDWFFLMQGRQIQKTQIAPTLPLLFYSNYSNAS